MTICKLCAGKCDLLDMNIVWPLNLPQIVQEMFVYMCILLKHNYSIFNLLINSW